MTNKEIEKLTRKELIQMLLTVTEENDRLNGEIEKLNHELKLRKIAIESSGTMAEAAMKLNRVFEAADAAAKQYLQNVKAKADAEIAAALEAEADKILAEISPRSVTVALCVEGKQLTSPELAEFVDRKATDGASGINFIIGSSYGLSPRVKAAADLKLSMSKLTFPHQLARVMLYEAVYRAGEINKGTKYHK